MFILQMGVTPFHSAVEQERSKIVKYFVEEILIDISLYDQVGIHNDHIICLLCK